MNFTKRLARGNPLLMDGALGTEIARRRPKVGARFEILRRQWDGPVILYSNAGKLDVANYAWDHSTV